VKTEGLKFDSGKIDFSLLPLEVLEPLIKVFEHGESKYGFENWRKDFGTAYRRRFIAAMLRHTKDAQRFPLAINEKDGGVYHLAQVAWNALILLHHEIEKSNVVQNDYSI